MHEPAEPCIRIQAHPVSTRSPVRAALRLMEAHHTHVLPVIERESGRTIGIVLRQALERGCLKMGHDPDQCLVAEHTLRDVQGVVGFRTSVPTRRSVSRQYRLLLDSAGNPLAILQYS